MMGDLIGDLEHDLVGEGDAEGLGGPHVDHEVEGHRLLDGEVGGLGTFKNAACIEADLAIHGHEIGAIAH